MKDSTIRLDSSNQNFWPKINNKKQKPNLIDTPVLDQGPLGFCAYHSMAIFYKSLSPENKLLSPVEMGLRDYISQENYRNWTERSAQGIYEVSQLRGFLNNKKICPKDEHDLKIDNMGIKTVLSQTIKTRINLQGLADKGNSTAQNLSFIFGNNEIIDWKFNKCFQNSIFEGIRPIDEKLIIEDHLSKNIVPRYIVGNHLHYACEQKKISDIKDDLLRDDLKDPETKQVVSGEEIFSLKKEEFSNIESKVKILLESMNQLQKNPYLTKKDELEALKQDFEYLLKFKGARFSQIMTRFKNKLKNVISPSYAPLYDSIKDIKNCEQYLQENDLKMDELQEMLKTRSNYLLKLRSLSTAIQSKENTRDLINQIIQEVKARNIPTFNEKTLLNDLKEFTRISQENKECSNPILTINKENSEDEIGFCLTNFLQTTTPQSSEILNQTSKILEFYSRNPEINKLLLSKKLNYDDLVGFQCPDDKKQKMTLPQIKGLGISEVKKNPNSAFKKLMSHSIDQNKAAFIGVCMNKIQDPNTESCGSHQMVIIGRRCNHEGKLELLIQNSHGVTNCPNDSGQVICDSNKDGVNGKFWISEDTLLKNNILQDFDYAEN